MKKIKPWHPEVYSAYHYTKGVNIFGLIYNLAESFFIWICLWLQAKINLNSGLLLIIYRNFYDLE